MTLQELLSNLNPEISGVRIWLHDDPITADRDTLKPERLARLPEIPVGGEWIDYESAPGVLNVELYGETLVCPNCGRFHRSEDLFNDNGVITCYQCGHEAHEDLWDLVTAEWLGI